jgi:pimeloyl-ACP methyl ester carboxylesterase
VIIPTPAVTLPMRRFHSKRQLCASMIDAPAGRGYRVIMPDLRAHGDSARLHESAAYPPDIFADDGLALIGHLGLADYCLAGFFSACGTVTFAPGSDEKETEGWLRSMDGDPKALLLALALTGAEEPAIRTAQALADAAQRAWYGEVPGHHFTAKMSRSSGRRPQDFLAE